MLLSIALENSQLTCDIEDQLGCSNKTALNKLHELRKVDVINATKWGNAYCWELNTNKPSLSDLEGDLTRIQLTELLTNAIEKITEYYITNFDSVELTSEISDWIDDRSDTDNVDPHRYTTNCAVFNRFLKSTLYTLHQSENDSLKSLDPGTDWNSQFETAENATDNHAFAPSLIDTYLPAYPESIDSLLLALRHLVIRAENPSGALADVYGRLISQDARRDLGQFATPNHIGQFMASWAITDPSDTILDPGIGAGQLAYQALQNKMDRGCRVPMPDITGVDVDEIAITMAATALKLADGPGS
ncbi:MAG: N-6 DNA methylase, partial [Halobacteriaceae archaeon]